MQKKPLILALLAGLALSGAAQATLTVNVGGLVYDSGLNITWLQNANLAASNTFGVSGINANGSMTWDTANAWIAAMNTAGYLGQSNWMLPTALNQNGTGPCVGYNCTSSQMGELFYTEGGLSANQAITASSTLTSHFSNMQSDLYWSGTAYVPVQSAAWDFSMADGNQLANGKSDLYYAWAVLPGNVAAVPEADAWAMLLAGLGLVGVVVRRRRG